MYNKMKGRFGKFGGRYVPETLMGAVEELEEAFMRIKDDKEFVEQYEHLLRDYAGRPTPLTYAENISKEMGFKIYLKREDLLHTGAHKINNAIGQALLAKNMGKDRIIAETGAGQHGVATATAAAVTGMSCNIYMGKKDMERQRMNVLRMELLGAKVTPVFSGSMTLKDAINEAMRDWITNLRSTHYLLGSVLGPHPYPTIIREFQRIIGKETREQIVEKEGRLPNAIVACVGGGSNSIGIFYEFIEEDVELIGVEAGGMGIESGKHAARYAGGREGVLHGTYTFVLQDEYGNIKETHSIAPGLDYPAVGPEHSHLREIKRVAYYYANDDDVIRAFKILAKKEGILPALESAHALSWIFENKDRFDRGDIVIVSLSGRGDKDLEIMERFINENRENV